jgi:hypothetical protein
MSCQSSGVVRNLFLKKAKCEKRAKNAKKEVFELKKSDIGIKKWASCRCSIFALNDQVLK